MGRYYERREIRPSPAAPTHVFDPFPAALCPFLDLAGATPLVNSWVGNGGTDGCRYVRV
ncbi:hypothetical protein [Mycolicibacterium gadium]|uniref:Uncharacterized protein n=1 Tax=Mycolicibacterium gadium TaxID=1794 RepID=A0ABT6GKF0_MYCGU|nr:hypothetical protein [Mycolicibacterium gadium]MDG5481782.1 hypothetical protein [Mycolicibacterium gadium]